MYVTYRRQPSGMPKRSSIPRGKPRYHGPPKNGASRPHYQQPVSGEPSYPVHHVQITPEQDDYIRGAREIRERSTATLLEYVEWLEVNIKYCESEKLDPGKLNLTLEATVAYLDRKGINVRRG